MVGCLCREHWGAGGVLRLQVDDTALLRTHRWEAGVQWRESWALGSPGTSGPGGMGDAGFLGEGALPQPVVSGMVVAGAGREGGMGAGTPAYAGGFLTALPSLVTTAQSWGGGCPGRTATFLSDLLEVTEQTWNTPR